MRAINRGNKAAQPRRLVAAGFAAATLGPPRDPVIVTNVGPGPAVAPAVGIAYVLWGTAGLTLPAPRLLASAVSSEGANALTAVLPPPSLDAYGGATAALLAPAVVVDISATVTSLGAAALIAPPPRLTAAGTAAAIGGATLAFGSLLGTYRIVGYSGAVLSAAIGGVTVIAAGIGGATGRAALTLPLFDLVAFGTTLGLSSAELLAPSPRLGATAQAWLTAPHARLVAVGTATVAATYEAYAINLNHKPRPGAVPVDEMTHYTNFPFDRIVRYKNSYFGVAADGLYLLEGTTDHAEPTPMAIPWAWKTGLTDFDTAQKKTVESMYFGGRLGAMTVTLYAGENSAPVYSYPRPGASTVQNYRQIFGRGVKERYYAFGASGSAAMELDDIDFSVGTLKRKI